MRYAVIMAGGVGKRLWPMSRKGFPKQLLPIVGDQSLLELAVNRLDGLFEPENIFIITSRQYADDVRKCLGSVPDGNVIEEPEGRDTCNAIALMTEILSGRDEEGTMCVFTADHVIRPEQELRRVVEHAMNAVEADPEALLTFGVRPSWPHTGLGYIRRGREVAKDVFEVVSFHEKPDHATAAEFIGSGEYLWNSGMFVWTLGAIRNAIGEYVPATAEALAPVSAAVAAGEDYTPIVDRVFPGLEKQSIDYAVMEKAMGVITVELGCEWIDLGSWIAMGEIVDEDGNGNVLMAERCELQDSQRNVIVCNDDNHLLAIAGVKDCVIVHTDDATLVSSHQALDDLKDMVDGLNEKFDGRYT